MVRIKSRNFTAERRFQLLNPQIDSAIYHLITSFVFKNLLHCRARFGVGVPGRPNGSSSSDGHGSFDALAQRMADTVLYF